MESADSNGRGEEGKRRTGDGCWSQKRGWVRVVVGGWGGCGRAGGRGWGVVGDKKGGLCG